MATKAKKLVDVQIGDRYPVIKRVVSKFEDELTIKLTFDDGTDLVAEKSKNPALEVEA